MMEGPSINACVPKGAKLSPDDLIDACTAARPCGDKVLGAREGLETAEDRILDGALIGAVPKRAQRDRLDHGQ